MVRIGVIIAALLLLSPHRDLGAQAPIPVSAQQVHSVAEQVETPGLRGFGHWDVCPTAGAVPRPGYCPFDRRCVSAFSIQGFRSK